MAATGSSAEVEAAGRCEPSAEVAADAGGSPSNISDDIVLHRMERDLETRHRSERR
jgi:hypothetical protein